jgi:hypothetical protein
MWCPLGDGLNWMPSPPGHDDELMELEMSLMTVLLGRRYASNRFLLTSFANSLRSSARLSSLTAAAAMVLWLAAYDGHLER